MSTTELPIFSAQSDDSPSARTCPFSQDFDPTRCPRQTDEPIQCARDYFYRSIEKYSDNKCLGFVNDAGEPYQWWTYSQVADLVKACRASMAALGIQKGDRIGLYARNCAQWVLVQYAALTGGFVPVPIYDTLGPNIVEYVCNHAEVKAVFVSAANFSKLAAVRDQGKLPTVLKVVVIGHADIAAESAIDECVSTDSAGIVSIVDFIDQGKELEKANALAEPELNLDDLFVIMYTSGTTGDPKGVKLTQRNYIASVASAHAYFSHYNYPFISGKEIHFSYLTLAHIYEQQIQAVNLSIGGAIGFFSGDIKKLVEDLSSLRPTKFVGVPRVYARFQQRIQENVGASSFIKQTLFRWAYDRQLLAIQNPMSVDRNGLWDKLVFNKVRGRLLPDSTFAVTGAAPMSPETNDFLSICLNMPVIQGYGLTETVGGMACSAPGRSLSGSVGGPLPGVHIKLRDLPDMGYLSTDKPYPRGEVCCKGDFVFVGYHNNDAETKKAFDDEGYFRTGDVGQWLADGSLQIIDRAKNLFKLQQGEYVSPDPLEQEYAKANLVGQIFVYGNSLHSTLVAAVVPDVPAAKAWASSRAKGNVSLEDIIAMDEFKKDVLAELETIRDRSKFKKYERIVDCIFDVSDLNSLGQGFHVDNDLMTPTFKLKRPQLKRRYGEQLDALYQTKA